MLFGYLSLRHGAGSEIVFYGSYNFLGRPEVMMIIAEPRGGEISPVRDGVCHIFCVRTPR